ncbi:sigma-70 family RNA polymerase sigma factor [Companilactobacillus sp. HBUAS56275]|uniref:sigma-70 family RNA polymerase sigma factor n=1 Tax=Companilactobacillus sp. HBUAS56275 TaxID=3109364 RepID=UPI002FF0B2BA
MNLEQGFQHALANQQLIHGALKRVHIYVTRCDYEDYFQEAMIIYAQTYVNYCQRKQDLSKFRPYVFQKLVWRLTDMLRQEKQYFDFHSLEEFDFQRVPEEEMTKIDFIDWQKLSQLEKEIFQEHFMEGISLAVIARRHQQTPRNLRYQRNRLLDKLREMQQK